MTRKDYRLIASAIERGISGNTVAREGGIYAVVSEVASALQLENPRFDRAKFLQACGVGAAGAAK